MKNKILRVDSHQHYWKPERADYGWLKPDNKVLYKDFLPEQLRPHLETCGIDKTIVVQAAPTIAETEFLLELCETEETLAGVVGWIEMDDDSFSDHFYRLLENPYFIGIRPMIQDLEDQWILRPKVLQSFELLVKEDFPIDLQANLRHLPFIIKLLKQLPDLRAVIDHLAKPNMRDKVLEPWKTEMAEMAMFKNVTCKLSGMSTSIDFEDFTPDDFIPYVHHMIDVFGKERVMFGSDWPVSLLASDYSQTYHALLASLPYAMTEEDHVQLFGQNAIRFYKLDHRQLS